MVAIKKTKKQPTPGFKSNLKDISRYKTWPKMTKEWLFLAYYLITGQYKTCPGDPKRITHICVIINEHNHNQLEICNSCSERYMDIFESGKIENDVRRLKANIKLSMSSTSLDYLRDNHAISTDEYNGYQMVRGIRNDSYVLEFRSDINQKLLAITDYNNKSLFDTIDQIVIWIHKNPQTDINIKTLFDIRHSLLTTNTYNSEWLESIITKNKIVPINYSLIERAEAYKIFDKYLNIPNEEWSRFIKYYGKDLETNIEKEVLPKGVIRNKRGILTYNMDLEPDTIIKKEVNEKVDKQYNRESSQASTVKKRTVIYEENIQTIPTKKNDVPVKKVEYSTRIDLDSEDKAITRTNSIHTQSTHSFNNKIAEFNSLSDEEKCRRRAEEKRLREEKKDELFHFRNLSRGEYYTITSELLSSDTIHKISELIIENWQEISDTTSINDIIDKFHPIFEELVSDISNPITDLFEAFWDEYDRLKPSITCLYDLLFQLRFGVVKHIISLILSKSVNTIKGSIPRILNTPVFQKVTSIFSMENMSVKCIGDSKPLKPDDWEIGPKPDPNYYIRREFLRNEIKDIKDQYLKVLISKWAPFENFFDYFNQWMTTLAESDSCLDILSFIDVGDLWGVYDWDRRRDTLQKIFDFVTVETFDKILMKLFKAYPEEIETRVEELSSFLGDNYSLKYDPVRKCTFFKKEEPK